MVRSERLTEISGCCDEGSAPSPVSCVRVRLRSAGDVHQKPNCQRSRFIQHKTSSSDTPLRQHVDLRHPSQPWRHSLPEFKPPPISTIPGSRRSVPSALHSCVDRAVLSTCPSGRMFPRSPEFRDRYPSPPTLAAAMTVGSAASWPERGERRNRLWRRRHRVAGATPTRSGFALAATGHLASGARRGDADRGAHQRELAPIVAATPIRFSGCTRVEAAARAVDFRQSAGRRSPQRGKEPQRRSRTAVGAESDQEVGAERNKEHEFPDLDRQAVPPRGQRKALGIEDVPVRTSPSPVLLRRVRRKAPSVHRRLSTDGITISSCRSSPAHACSPTRSFRMVWRSMASRRRGGRSLWRRFRRSRQ